MNLVHSSLATRLGSLSLVFSLGISELVGGSFLLVNLILLLHGGILEPIASIVTLHAWRLAIIIMSGKEWLVVVALTFESLQLRRHEHLAVLVEANIKRYYANGVAGDEELVAFGVVEGEGKNTVELFHHLGDAAVHSIFIFIHKGRKVGILAHFAVKGKYYLTVGACLILVLASETCADILVVVDLAIHGKHLFLVRREEGLTAAFRINDT